VDCWRPDTKFFHGIATVWDGCKLALFLRPKRKIQVKRIVIFALLVLSSVAWSISANAQSPGVAEYARESREASRKSAKKQQRMFKKASKRQRKAMKKYAKAQRKAAKKANRRAR
jgi:hypothetical protein